MTRLNSVEMGGCVSRTTISMACRNDEPDRSALAMSVMVSASAPLKALRRLPLRRLSQKRGIHQPTTTPTSVGQRVAQGGHDRGAQQEDDGRDAR